MPSYLNETLISLIPKCQNPESLSNYRPISLCNSVYKVVSKIIVACIKPYLSNLISLAQTAFVPGRRGTDNVLIAQELFPALDNKKGRADFMAIKLDLEEVYDKLEWSFIHRVLQTFQFPPKILKIIMSCITSPNTTILVNGGALEPFEPMRGIRQGDPLSPYIFILCMEYLGHLIDQKCVDGSWTPLKAFKENLGFSHLLSRLILFYFARLTLMPMKQFWKCLRNFVQNPGKKLARKSPAFTFLQMLMKV